MANTGPLPSRIAALVHAHFDALPKRSKPIVRDDGTAEWIPMTGIVLVKGENTPSETLTCVAVTSGAKCLPASQIPSCKGLVLHDSHAEILAMRAFNFWLLSECHSVLAHEKHVSTDKETCISPYLRRRQIQSPHVQNSSTPIPPFELRPDVKIYMYCTCAPCGDASMELTMAAQDDPTPWEVPSSNTMTPEGPGPESTTLLAGRAHFSKLGIVRRKPARADAESTKSKSCSDKIALRQVLSLLNYETSLLVAPTASAYIAGLVLPEEEITRVGCERCFGAEGRMRDLNGRLWPVVEGRSGTTESDTQYRYEFRPFQILSISNEQLKSLWPFRKPRASDPVPEDQQSDSVAKKSKPGNISAIWVRAPSSGPESLACLPSFLVDNGSKRLPALRGSKTGLFENIINGVKQGHRPSSPAVRGASALSRAKLWGYIKEIISGSSVSIGEEGGDFNDNADKPVSLLQTSTYREFKRPPDSMGVTQARNRAIQGAREVLQGWVPNSGDEEWGLEVLVDSKKRKR